MCDRCNGYGTKKPENELRDDTRLAIDYVDTGIPISWPPVTRPWVPLPEDQMVYEAVIMRRAEQQAQIHNLYAQAAYAQPQVYPTQQLEFIDSQIQHPYAQAAYAQPQIYPIQQPEIIDPQMLGVLQQQQGQKYALYEQQLDPGYYQPQPNLWQYEPEPDPRYHQPQPNPRQYQPQLDPVYYESQYGQGQPQPGRQGRRPPHAPCVSTAPAPDPNRRLSGGRYRTGTNDAPLNPE